MTLITDPAALVMAANARAAADEMLTCYQTCKTLYNVWNAHGGSAIPNSSDMIDDGLAAPYFPIVGSDAVSIVTQAISIIGFFEANGGAILNVVTKAAGNGKSRF